MALDWNDNLWLLQTEQPSQHGAPPYVGNGRIGLRLGTLILGTDPDAPPLTSSKAERCIDGIPRYDHSFPLQTFTSYARDGLQLCLPSWANLKLVVNGHRLQPLGLTTSSTLPLRTWLDMRTGEAGLDGIWRLGDMPINVQLRLLIPRGEMQTGALWELTLEGLTKPAELEFGLIGSHALGEMDITYAHQHQDLVGSIRTKANGRAIEMGLRWQCDADGGITESFRLDEPGNAQVRIVATGPKVALRVLCSIRGGMESFRPTDVHADLDRLHAGTSDGSIRKENAEAWRAIWKDGLDVATLPLERHDQQLLLAQQFYLLASYDGSDYPVGPLGLAGNQWGGRMLWDSDLWHFQALNALWPTLARQVPKARMRMLPEARRRAKELNLAGAWFGVGCDENGIENAKPPYRNEIHVNAWIALAAYESAMRSDDLVWLNEVYPIISGIADAACTRATRDDEGVWHILKVLPPDESVVENPKNPGTCDDSITTNLAFAAALRAAIDAAKRLGRVAPPRWKEVADGLFILPPGPDGVIPEYRGYSGHEIKQADVILSFYPLGHDAPDDIVRANVDYYRDKIVSGPLMTEQVDACIRLQRNLGEREAVLRDLIKRYRRYVHGPFEVPYECIDNSNSIMLTACGGILGTLIYGWFGVSPARQDWSKAPRIAR